LPTFDTIVIGAGAAGLMCAIEAGKRGRRVAVIEHTDRPGNKILISGGGRCNFTNLHTTPDNFISQNPHFAKSALARYTPADFIALVEKHHIPYHEKTLGQLFCDRSAKDITGLLEAECRAANVKVILDTSVKAIRRDTAFTLETNTVEYTAPTVVIATGGLSIPKMGATDFGYRIAKQFGLRIVPPRPALVPLLVKGYTELAGVSTEVIASIHKRSFREKMLFTHRGLSGPAILQISSYLPGPLIVDLMPGIDIRSKLHKREGELTSILSEHLPKRLAALWPSKPLAQMSAHEIDDIATGLHAWDVQVNGTEGFEKAEVTAGGVDTAELSSATMEARKVPGLFFIGEVVDVTGHLGGFNFQWAWASGVAAGNAV
jgi:predicted Rossmann fold flavoprotein